MGKSKQVEFVHLHENRGLYIMTVQSTIITGWFRKNEVVELENYVSMNGVSWSLMPGKESAELHINDQLVKMFNEQRDWSLIEDLHKCEEINPQPKVKNLRTKIKGEKVHGDDYGYQLYGNL